MFGAHRIQRQEALQGAAVVLRQVLPELLEHRRLDRMRPVVGAHEARGRGDHRQRADLRQRGGGMQREQAAQ